MKNELWLIWEESISRIRYKIGILSKENDMYKFRYVNPELNDAKDVGFKYFPEFKDLTNGENESLRQTYGEYQQNGGDIGSITEFDEICYWCPKKIEDAKEATAIIFNYLRINAKYFENMFKEIIGDDKNDAE